MPHRSHHLHSVLVGLLALGCTVIAVGAFWGSADLGSTTIVPAAPLAEGYPYPYPGPTPTATPLPDLIAGKLEVTQAVQDLDNSVRLVAGKRTYVRFHVRSARGVFATTARLTVRQGDATQLLAPLNPGGLVDVRPAPDRAAGNHAFLFELPDGFKTGAVSLTAQLNPMDTPKESSLANNQVATTVAFEAVPPINLVTFAISYQLGGKRFTPAEEHRDKLVEWLRQAYPLSQVNLWTRTLDLGAGQVDGKGNLLKPSCGDVNSMLASNKLLDQLYDGQNISHIPPAARYYGLVSDGGGGQFMRGCALGIPSFVAAGPAGGASWGWDFDGSYADWYGAHEIAHTYGRFHAEFCDALGGVAYPYAGGRISPVLEGERALYGFNTGSQAIYGPQWKDLMTYCSYQWVSDFTYEGLMTQFQTQPVAAAGLLEEPAGDRLLVSGAIDPATAGVTLQPILRLPNLTEVTPRAPGPYAIVLLNAANRELAHYPFTPAASTAGPATTPGEGDRESLFLIISELVPLVEGTTRVAIRGPENQVLLAIAPGSSTPTVELVEPDVQRAPAGSPIIVAWTASDPDGDPLSFTVQYSTDGGQSWLAAAQNIQGQQVAIDPVNLPASTAARFRVWATDGLNTSYAESGADVVLANRAPTVEILAPANGAIFAAGQTVTLEGSGYDVDTGSLTGASLRWRSSRDGDLGSGENLSNSSLTAGDHTITLTASDDQGASAQATIQLMILGSFSEEQIPSYLVIGPELVALDPVQGIPAAVVAVDNQRAGTRIPWSATANAPWLQLNKSQGTTPGTLTLSAKSGGLAPGNYQGIVTFSSSATLGQTVELPVVLTVRNAKVLLPYVGR